MKINSNWTADGHPDGGVSYGPGFCISWQRGSLVEDGRNGAFLVEVLEACQSRLEHHQSGQLACDENTIALAAIERALTALNNRLTRRANEGNLGTHVPDQKT